MEDPLGDLFSVESSELSDFNNIVVNGRQNKSLGESDNKNLSSQLQLYRRFGNKGRNMAVSSNINYRDGNNQNANLSMVRLYQQKNRLGLDSTYQTNRYTTTPSDNLSYSIGVT